MSRGVSDSLRDDAIIVGRLRTTSSTKGTAELVQLSRPVGEEEDEGKYVGKERVSCSRFLGCIRNRGR